MEITRKNFSENFDNIAKDLKHCCFIGFDAEFTAILSSETFKYRLFDTNEERYDLLKKEVSKMIMTQVGLTVFRYDRDNDTYIATGYTFHLCPQAFGNINQSFIFQASTLKFLCKHNFDFNKFTYEGLPYLSKIEAEQVRRMLKDNSSLQYLNEGLEIEEERELQQYCSEVSKWLCNSDEGTMYLDVVNSVLRYLVHREVRLRFPDVLTTDSLGNSNKILIYRDKYVEGANSAPVAVLEENLMNHLLGFSQILSLLESYKKPIVGHNIFMDTVLLHNQFIGPLPNKYATFKKNVNKMFPQLYDTKYISHDMGKKLTYDELWKTNVLQDLYEFFSEGKCKKLQNGVNLIKLKTPFGVKQSYHEAGWDSYCSGYCFARLGHWAACEASGKYKPVGPTEKLAALQPYCNKVNVIRAALPYMDFVSNDPPTHRPALLHIKVLNEPAINVTKNTSKVKYINSGICYNADRNSVAQVASILASFGSLDIKPYGNRTALIATSSQITLNRILKQFKDSRDYRVSMYSVYKHSVPGRVAIWSGAIITCSLVLFLIHRKVK